MLAEASWQNWFMSDPRSALLEAVDGACSEAIDFTKELIAIPTENPPGNEYFRCAESIARKLEQIGLPPRIDEVPGPGPGIAPGYCITTSHGEGERALHFHGHYDVVPRSVEGQFDPVIKGENLFGRGSSDMKSGLASMICAVQALRRARTPLHGRVELLIVPDEETCGARGTASLSHAPDFGKGSIGMLTAEPTSGAVWNANRGAISLRIRVKGKPAHVGLSCQGVNAFEHMLVMARELEKLKSEVAGRETAFRIRPEAARRSILMMGGECRGGSNFNLVPGDCSFTVDRRINPEEDIEAEKRRLFDLFSQLRRDGIDHEVEVLQEGLSAGAPEYHPLAQILGRTIESITGNLPAFEMCPGLLETRFYAARGIPAMAYGPGLLSVSHGPNEFVPLRNIRHCAAVYALTAAAALAKPL
jgi:acetylornithine deacetylase/succinyl-diaminopimelate desuccinylase family protein